MDMTETRPETKGEDGQHCQPAREYFDPGECFCEVRCLRGHPVRLFNIRRTHVVACDRCKVYVSVGGNLMSWRHENEETWRINRRSIQGYKEVQL